MSTRRDLQRADEVAEEFIPHLWKKTMKKIGVIIEETLVFTDVHKNKEFGNNLFNNAFKKILSEIAKTNDEFDLILSTEEKRLKYYKRVKKTIKSELDKIWDIAYEMEDSDDDNNM